MGCTGRGVHQFLNMRLNIVTLCVVFLSSASALFVPRQRNALQLGHHRNHGLARRNDTAAMAGELTLNIDPDIDTAACGGIYEAQISVAQAPDPFYLSTPCQNILGYIGGNKGKKEVDIIFACTGQASGTGVGDLDTKMVFNIVASAVVSSPASRMIASFLTRSPSTVAPTTSHADRFSQVNGANSGTQLVPSNLELVNVMDNTFITTQVNLGVKMSGTKAIFQYIYC